MKKGSAVKLLSLFGFLFLLFAGAELLFRSLLFSQWPVLEPLRNPSLYADGSSSDDFWKLRVAFGGTAVSPKDRLLGYLHPKIAPGTYTHTQAEALGSRIPVLLFGDSFADCSTPPEECFEGILNADPSFAEKYYLINYGVGSYGLDQIYLLYRKVIQSYPQAVVLFSFLDEDMDRSILTMREGQKPYFTLEEGQLQLQGVPVEMSGEAFFAKNPLHINSYLVRLLLYGVMGKAINANSPINPTTAEKKALTRAILLKVQEDLRARDIRHLFLVFEGLHRTWKRPVNWRVEFLDELFTEYRIPHVWAREIVETKTHKETFDLKDYVYSSHDHHPSYTSNKLIAEYILAWLQTSDHQSP